MAFISRQKLLLASLGIATLLEAFFGSDFGRLLFLLILALGTFWWWSNRAVSASEHLTSLIRGCRRTVLVGLVCWLGLFALVEYRIHSWSSPVLTATPDWLVVLGAGLRGETPAPLLEQRLIRTVNILQTHPQMRVVVSGGQGYNEAISEAEAMRRYLVTAGIANERIFLEDHSFSTFDNITLSHRLLSKLNNGSAPAAWILTSEFHLYRASKQATALNWQHAPVSAPTPWLLIPVCNLRESITIGRDWLQERYGW